MLSVETKFDKEFQLIQGNLQKMGELVSTAIRSAMTALVNRDVSLAESVVNEDIHVNEIRYQIEEECFQLLATNQPAAKDLRAVIAVMFIVVEIERIGDHAAGIAKTVILMEDEPLLKTVKKIPKMGEISHQMFLECMVAFVNRDAKLAQEIAARDTEMDDLYRSVFDHLIEIMAKRPKTITQANYLSWCAHNLERIADRVTNISERIIFMTTGIVQELDNS